MEKIKIITPAKEVAENEAHLILGITLERYEELEHKIFLYIQEREKKYKRVSIVSTLKYISKISVHVNELAYMTFRISQIIANPLTEKFFILKHQMIEDEKVSKMVQGQQKD